MIDSATMNPLLARKAPEATRVLVAAVAATAAFAAALGGIPVILATTLLLGLVTLAVAAVARPAMVLLAFVVLLPFHLLTMVLFFNAGVDHDLLRAFSVWKELTAVVVLSVLIARHLASGKLPRVRVLDAVILAFIAWNLLYLITPIGSPFRAPLVTRVQGLRDNVFFVFLYFIGRMAPMSRRDLRLVLSSAVSIGFLGVFVGLLERLLIPIDFFFRPLHFDDFQREYLNLHYHTGLPFNFWTSVGNFRRGVSFYLGSHHFAASFLLLIPLVLGLRRPLRSFPRNLRLPLLLLAGIGLLLPLTRSVILACILQILLLGIIDRRPHWIVTAGTAVLLILGSSLVFLDLGSYFSSVARAVPGSSVYTHAVSWADTVQIVRDYPLGVGFGVADTAAERVGSLNQSLSAGEGEYAFTVTTVGLPGLFLFLLLQLSVAATVMGSWLRARDPASRNLAMVVLMMVVGYAVVGSFTQVRHVPALMYPLWWLIGTVVQGELAGGEPRDRESGHARQPAETEIARPRKL